MLFTDPASPGFQLRNLVAGNSRKSEIYCSNEVWEKKESGPGTKHNVWVCLGENKEIE